MDGAELVGFDPNDGPRRADLFQDGLHAPSGVRQMLTVADEDEALLPREKIGHMGDHGFPIHLDEGFGDGVSGATEALSEA